MSLADYLAKNYLTADPSSSSQKSSKKRKRKDKDKASEHTSHGLSIADDESWAIPSAQDSELADDATIFDDSSHATQNRGTWKRLGGAQPPSASASDADAASAIIASTIAENAARADAEAAEEAPQLAEDSAIPTMESGAAAGLQSADAVAAQMERRRAKERRRFEADSAAGGAEAGETIYRDASGRVINIALKRAEARREAEAAQRKEKEEKAAAGGEVQRRERERAREELKEARMLTVARYADDEELNEELKGQERWNDPAAQFLTKRKEGRSGSGRPLYKGAAMPNRYGIKPGYRWDGVDRSNGYEREYFEAQNRRKNEADLRYKWEMDE